MSLLKYFFLIFFAFFGVLDTKENPILKKSEKLVAHKRDVFAIGQAIYDIYLKLNQTEFNALVKKMNLIKGCGQEISKSDVEFLLTQFPNPTKKKAGGSVANTIAGIATLGGKTGFLGSVAKDSMGNAFKEDMEFLKVETMWSSTDSLEKTAIVFSIISPDAERTMLAYPGISREITLMTASDDVIGAYKVVFSEAYVLGTEKSNLSLTNLYKTAKKMNTQCAFGLSADHMVKKHRPLILSLLKNIDILFGNFEEMSELFQSDSLQSLFTHLETQPHITSVITLGEKGAWILSKGEKIFIPPSKVGNILDTTGAGDMFAAGFLYGYTHGYSLEQSGKLGAKIAGYIIQQIGARPEDKITHLLEIPYKKKESIK